MDKQDLKQRNKKFAVETIHFINSLPKSKANDVISYQVFKSATTVAANYCASLTGGSPAEFISKPNIVLEEANESMFWFEVLKEKNDRIDQSKPAILHKESDELTAIFTASFKTARKNLTSKTLNLTS